MVKIFIAIALLVGFPVLLLSIGDKLDKWRGGKPALPGWLIVLVAFSALVSIVAAILVGLNSGFSPKHLYFVLVAPIFIIVIWFCIAVLMSLPDIISILISKVKAYNKRL